MQEKLKETDPEFYEFLQKEDKDLLQFDDDEDDSADDNDNDSSDDSDDQKEAMKKEKSGKKKEKAASRAFEKEILEMSSGGSDSDDSEEEGGGMYRPPQKLEVASDDDDWDDDADEPSDDSDGEEGKKQKTSGKLITMSMIKMWTSQMQKSPSPEIIRDVVAAFAAAVKQAGCIDDLAESNTQYRVKGSTVFNAVIRLCLTQMVPVLQSVLGLPSLADAQHTPSQKNKRWKSVRGTVKNYCALVLQLTGELAEPNMVNIVLKHAHKLVVCYAAFPKLAKAFMKKTISLWSAGEETTRVVAFLCVNKLTRLLKDTLLEPCLKQMYLAYVSNCKFVSPTSLPLINFMQRSLVEVLMVDETIAYQHAFLYIRQLAIHLRNAITVKKKELCQAVYNWQYVLSLGLWTRLLSTTHPSATLQPLIYPLTQTIIGTIRLLPTARYYPLRFHCVRYLTTLSGATNTFIPVLPFLLEVLEQTDFNKRPKSGSMKNFNMATILKFTKPQLLERAFKDTLVDQLYELLLDNLHVHSHTVTFPELIVPMVIQLKDFLKKCKVANYCKQLKQIVEKGEETAKVVTARRKMASFNLADIRAVDQWEARSKEEGTPLSKFYTSWRKLRDRELQQDIAKKDQVSGAAMELPEIIRQKGPLKATTDDKREFGALFADDSDDDDVDDNIRFLPKGEKEEAMRKKRGVDIDSDEEDYSDFDSDELEQLARSASEGETSEESEEEEVTKKGPPPKSAKRRSSAGDTAKNAKAKRTKLDSDTDLKDIVEEFEMSGSDFE